MSTIERVRLAIFGSRVDEALVDLDLVEREIPHLGEARMACAEIVERDPHARRRHRLDRRAGGLRILHDGRLGQLDLEPGRRKADLFERRDDIGARARIGELRGRQVERQCDVARPARRRRRLAKEVARQLVDEPDAFGGGDEDRRFDRAEARVGPARKRFEAADAARREIDDRLKEDGDLVVRDRAVQRLFELGAAPGGLFVVLVVYAEASASVGLRPVERDVGEANELVRLIGRGRKERES